MPGGNVESPAYHSHVADDPFKGVPFLGDLARMLSKQGPIAWDAARQLAYSIATEGQSEPNIDPIERMKLEQLARVADLHVAEATGLSTSVTGRSVEVVPVTRGQWVQQTLDAYRPLFESLGTTLAGAGGGAATGGAPVEESGGEGDDPEAALLANLMQMLGPMMLGMAAGSMIGHLATRSFGQYDLPVPRAQTDQLSILTGNLTRFGDEWSLPADDLRLWICLHELSHHAVLGVDHVRARLSSLISDYVAGFEPDGGSLESRLGDVDPSSMSNLQGLQQLFGDPEILLGVTQSPAQRELLPQLETLVAVILGYVDHVMDRVGGTLISSYAMVTEALRRRRVEAGDADRFVERLFGLELGQRCYDRGAAFVDGVVERGGDGALARLWRVEAELPTPAELDAPGLWLARIDL